MRILAALLVPVVVPAQSSFVGSEACASCHPTQAKTHSSSRHANALRPILESELLDRLLDRPIRERGGVRYQYKRSANGLTATALRYRSDVSTEIESADSAILEWTFGAGSQGLTAVGRRGATYFEHRVSYNPRRQRPAITLGHPIDPPRQARDLLGIDQPPATAFRCFNCHATNVLPASAGPDLSNSQAGVQCERCHGPGAAHVEAATSSERQSAVALIESRRLKSMDSVKFCGQCHRLPDPGKPNIAPERDDPLNVRFQPMGLLASRCFKRSERLSCITCHDPHENARPDAKYYREKCLDCHVDAGQKSRRCRRSAREDCLPCHMPRTEPSPNLVFTDHRIRVLNSGA